jgi:predicted nucleic acid-binding protein
MSALFDTGTIIAINKADDAHHVWAVDQLEKWKEVGPITICDVNYAELSTAFPSRESLDEMIDKLAIERIETSDDALFNSGKIFLEYRKRNGTKTGVLPDFFIGSVALDKNLTLVTTNAKDFVSKFHGLHVVKP